MTTPDYPVYDFKRAAADDDSAHALRRWLGGCSEVMCDVWNGLAGTDLEIELSDVATRTYAESIQDITRNCGGFFRNVGTGQAVSLWHITPTGMLAIARELLGQKMPEDPDGQGPTRIEISLCTLFFEEFIDALLRGWPGRDPLSISEGEPVQLNPGSKRLFRARDLTAHIRLRVKLNIGDVDINWIMAKDQMTALLAEVLDRRHPEDPETSIENVVEQLAVEVTASLGSRSIPMRQLLELSPGDLLVLDQKISDPVLLTIDGNPLYEGWPGKVGRRQGIEIARTL